MIELTKEQIALITHIASGGKILENNYSKSLPAEPEFVHYSIGGKGTPVSIHTLCEEYSIYFSPEQEEINRLKDLLDIQNAELQKALAKNKELTPSRKHRPQLTRPVVVDIETALAAGASTPEIESSYEVSATVISKIRRGAHPLSTPAPGEGLVD